MGKRLIFALVIVGVLFLVFHHSAPPTSPTSSAVFPEPSTRSFAGYDCTGDCSGHEAGYNWAEEHGMDNEDQCDTAGDSSNSPSFAEGCKAYVNGESSSSDDDEDQDDSDGRDTDDQSRLAVLQDAVYA